MRLGGAHDSIVDAFVGAKHFCYRLAAGAKPGQHFREGGFPIGTHAGGDLSPGLSAAGDIGTRVHHAEQTQRSPGAFGQRLGVRQDSRRELGIIEGNENAHASVIPRERITWVCAGGPGAGLLCFFAPGDAQQIVVCKQEARAATQRQRSNVRE